MSSLSNQDYTRAVAAYQGLHDDAQTDVEARRAQYATLVNQYYDLATDFYEFGWGQSFHFAPRREGEPFAESLAKHERRLADALALSAGMRALDVGCGVGGPMREIARYSGAKVVGVNNNAYQISRGVLHTARAGLADQCSFLKADFMALPFPAACFDAVYTIEASCHAPDKTALFRELHRVMKPGAIFAGYEWCLTDRYDERDPDHRRIKKDIEAGDGLPDIARTHEVDRALETAGFELVRAQDLATADDARPWYLSLTGEDRTLRSLPRTPIGRVVTNVMTGVLERLRLAPAGTQEVSAFLNAAADALVAGGACGIFTPMYFFQAKKR